MRRGEGLVVVTCRRMDHERLKWVVLVVMVVEELRSLHVTK